MDQGGDYSEWEGSLKNWRGGSMGEGIIGNGKGRGCMDAEEGGGRDKSII